MQCSFLRPLFQDPEYHPPILCDQYFCHVPGFSFEELSRLIWLDAKGEMSKVNCCFEKQLFSWRMPPLNYSILLKWVSLCTGQSGRERAHPLWIRTVQSSAEWSYSTLQVPCSYSCNVDTNDLVGSYTMAPHTGHFSHEYHVKGVHTHAVHMYTHAVHMQYTCTHKLGMWTCGGSRIFDCLFCNVTCCTAGLWMLVSPLVSVWHSRLMNNDAMFLLLCTTRYTSYCLCVCVYATCVYGSHDTQHVRHAAVWDL